MPTFTYTPDFGASQTKKPSVNSMRFGDGYEQRATFGINTNPSAWQLSFSMRDDTEATAIDAFLTARKGVEYFDWTPPGSSAGKYICREWTKTLDRNNLNTIQAKFEQVFDL